MDRRAPPPPLFRPHGRIECHREGLVVHTHAHGPFNVEAVRGYGAMLVGLLADLPAQAPYVVVATMSGSILAPPDAWGALEQSIHARQSGDRKQLGSGWVAAPDLEGRSLFVPRARTLYESSGIAFGIFEAEDDAKTWALRLLAPDARAARPDGGH